MKRLFPTFLLTLFLALSASCLAHAGTAEGEAVFKAKNCASCHNVIGMGQEKTVGDLQKAKGPELWYAGSKFKAAFLEKWLSSPSPIRPMSYYSLEKENQNDHPRLTSTEAKDVTAFLMTLKFKGFFSVGIKGEYSRSGRALFEKKFGCYGCHELIKDGNTIGGLSGPTLVGGSKRLNPDWIYAYLKNPKQYKSVMTMPVIAGLATDEELKTLAAFVASLE